jgi:rhodanese-related sulfurtransferase
MTYAGDLTPQRSWDLLAEHPDAVLVDVRTDAEWRYVGTPDLSGLGRQVVLAEWVRFPDGAGNPEFLAQLADAGIAPGAQHLVLFICRSGVRSVAAAKAATAAGIAPSYNVLDGFEGNVDAAGHRGVGGWKSAGLPWRQS